ncbi:hypothetical protein [Gracilimonas mengyeensis]|uniref:hypothetical protein n=1 Tax=Gracilimonas mengyeensis TaxID=1302730 RepID=UPI00115A7BA7|nr:hypothetical protein [Gracilimonas mengyeensis]
MEINWIKSQTRHSEATAEEPQPELDYLHAISWEVWGTGDGFKEIRDVVLAKCKILHLDSLQSSRSG